MSIYKFTNLDKWGRYRTRIFYKPDDEEFKIPKKGLGPFVSEVSTNMNIRVYYHLV